MKKNWSSLFAAAAVIGMLVPNVAFAAKASTIRNYLDRQYTKAYEKSEKLTHAYTAAKADYTALKTVAEANPSKANSAAAEKAGAKYSGLVNQWRAETLKAQFIHNAWVQIYVPEEEKSKLLHQPETGNKEEL